MHYLVVSKGNVIGCDTSIGCGISAEIKEYNGPVGSANEFFINVIKNENRISQIKEIIAIPIEGNNIEFVNVERHLNKQKEEELALENERKERAEYNRLRDKYGEGAVEIEDTQDLIDAENADNSDDNEDEDEEDDE